MRRAIEINPNNANAHYFYALVLQPENRLSESLNQFRAALALDPLSAIMTMNYAITLRLAGDREESLHQFSRTMGLSPAFAGVHLYASEFYAMEGHFQDAENEARLFRARIQSSDPPQSFSPDAQGFLKNTLSDQGDDYPSHIAVAYAIAGDRQKALDNLEKAFSVEDPELEAVIRYPAIAALKGDPRYSALMKRLGLPE